MNLRLRHFFHDWATVTLLFISFSAASAQTAARSNAGSLDDLQIPAPSLAGNLLGDPTTQHVFIYLPPSYRKDTAKRFPTLYLLHGYTGRPEGWVKDLYPGSNLQSEMDLLIAKGIAAEMIIVVPNGRNAYLGSFYTNSAVTGNWEDFIFRDVVSFIDSKYRTLARPSSRGIAGHSMGGYGAFMLAMKHPDVFGAVYSLSPCCLGFEGDFTADNPAWASATNASSRQIYDGPPASIEVFWTQALVAVSAAFSPNTERPPVYVDIPFAQKNGTLFPKEPAYSNFRSKLPLYLIEQYSSNLMKLRGIAIDVGEYDEFSHIRIAGAKLATELSVRGIPNSFEMYRDGDHQNKIRERFDTKVIPFFSKLLER